MIVFSNNLILLLIQNITLLTALLILFNGALIQSLTKHDVPGCLDIIQQIRDNECMLGKGRRRWRNSQLA